MTLPSNPGHPVPASRVGSDGSAVVTALLIGLVVSTVLMTLSAGSVGDSIASRARIDRVQASALAEYGIAVALHELDAGLAVELRRSAPFGGQSGAIAIPVSIPAAILEVERPGAVSLEVTLVRGSGTDDLLVGSRATVRRQRHESVARVRPRVTSDHLLLSAYEVLDPVMFHHPRSDCSATRGDVLRRSHCRDVVLDHGILDGPVHSNDALDLRSGVTVASMLTTSSLAQGSDGIVRPVLAPTADPSVLAAAPFGLHHEPSIDLPRTVAEVAAATTVTCRFRGPTLIRFDGQVTRVTSPRSIARAGDDLLGEGAIGCMGVDRQLLVQPTPLLLPDRAVIEVVRDPLSECADHPLGIALDEDDTRDWSCGDGDAFVWGTYGGQWTVMAEDRIQIVWDLQPDGTIEQGAHAPVAVIGLIAGDSIVLRRPVGPAIRRVAPYGLNLAFAGPNVPPFGAYPEDAPTDSARTWDAPRISASLVALRGSIGVQNPLRGQQHSGSVRIEGSVATRFHGLFAWEDRSATGALQGAMGYAWELRYDPDLLEVTPPGMPLTAGGAVRILDLEVLSGTE
jgi:hypothetical protein